MKRAWWHRQLAVKAWDRPGISPLNACSAGLILCSVLELILETEPAFTVAVGAHSLISLEWVFTALFTAEYGLRVWSAGENPRFAGMRGRLRYAFSLFALLDLLAILPTYLALGLGVGINTSWTRSLRFLRVIRLARFGAFSLALDVILDAFRSRRYELAVSFLFTCLLILVSSTIMYAIEGTYQPERLGSIPRAIWWSVITMTTVGYGDITPVTWFGKVVAGVVALGGIVVVAIPTGIMASAFSEIVQDRKRRWRNRP